MFFQPTILAKPPLAPKANALLEKFVMAANWSSIHSLDWRRFYKFVFHCHAKRVKLDEGKLRHILVSLYGVPAAKAEPVTDVYVHGRDLLKYGR